MSFFLVSHWRSISLRTACAVWLSLHPAPAAVDLSDPDVKRANDLLTRFDRFFQIAVPLCEIPPRIDGKVDAAEWKDASRLIGLVSLKTRHLFRLPSAFYLQHDDSNVYLAFQLDRPGGTPPKALTEGRANNLWNKEDGVELMFSPDTGRDLILSLFVNGRSGYSEGVTYTRTSAFDTSRAGGWTVKSRTTPQGIEGEVSIPKTEFADLLKKSDSLDTQSWGFSAMRADQLPLMEQADFTEMWSSGGYNGNFLGRIRFQPDQVGVRVDALGALTGGRVGLRGEIHAGGRPLKAKLHYAIYRALKDVEKGQIYLYKTWDKVQKIRTTGSDVDEGAAVQLFLGEKTWLQNLGQAYELLEDKEIAVESQKGGSAPFEAGVDLASGQFILAARLVDEGSGEVLWSQTVPADVPGDLDIQIAKRFLTLGDVVAKFDVSGSEKAKAGDQIRAAIFSKQGGEAIAQWEAPVDNKFLAPEHVFPMDEADPGSYVLRAQLVGQDGGTIAEQNVDFTKPPMPGWFKNRIGYSDEVPWPFTPVKASDDEASIWGRTYRWSANNPFPASITTKGNALLAAPIELQLVSQGQTERWKTEKWKLTSSTPRTATYEAVVKGGGFALNLQVTVDFDGLMRFQGQLSGSDAPVDSLKLVVPVRREMAAYYHASKFETIVELAVSNYQAGSLESFRKTFPEGATPFAGLFWLGGLEGGIQWIAEWDRGWQNPDRKNVMRVVESGDVVALEVSMIGEPTTLTEPLPMDFAFNVSPVKDPSYFWDYAMANGGSDALYPQNYNPGRLREDLQKAKDWGITHIIHGGFGWPFHADIWVRGHNRPHFKENAATVHDAGLKSIFYGCWGYSSNGEEAEDFAADMIKVPMLAAGTDTYWYNPEGPWVDFFMAGLENAIKEYGMDGIYFDSMADTGICADPLTGQTFTDQEGRVHGKWPTFALRDWALRALNVMHISPLKDGLVYQHTSNVPNLAIISVADIRCGGEDAPSTGSLKESWPLDSYFARFDTHAFGIPQETLWYNWWNRPLKENHVLAVILLHGQMKNRDPSAYIHPETANYDAESRPHMRILELYRDFNVAKADWWPYQGKENWIALSPSSLHASSYVHRGRKALVVVSNLEPQPTTAKVTLDLTKAGFSGAVTVRDALLETDIPLKGNTFELAIEPERYRLLLVEEKKDQPKNG